MAWKTFSLPKIPGSVDTAVNGLKSAASAASAGLSLVKGLLEALSLTATTGLSASQTAINVAVGTIQSALTSLTNDTGVYVLMVPPRSKVVMPPGVEAALSTTLFSTPTPEGLRTQALFAEEQTTSQQAKIIRDLFSATGGNSGFVRAVTESFDDEGDGNRPILSDSDAVAGMYIVAGAANIAALFPFTNGMSALLAPGQPTALDAPGIPVPRGFKAKVVSGNSVLLKWEYQPPIVELAALGTSAKVTEVAIIRSTSVRVLSTCTTQELFGTNSLSVGLKTADGASEVIAVIPYTGSPNECNYLDTAEHSAGYGYYYLSSFHVKLGTSLELSSGAGTDTPFTRLSNVSKVSLSKDPQGTPRSIEGIPPDWYRTSRTVDLFPAVGNLLNTVAGLTAQLGDTATGYGDLLKANVKVLDQQIKGYTDLATQLTASSAALTAYSSINLGAVSSRAFAGTGGVPFIKKDLIQAFGDTTDPNRPPFDNGEFVSGVVILATTPNAVALLEQILGSISSGVGAIAAALEKIDVELDALETATFDDSMAVKTATPVATGTSVSVPTPITSLVGEDAPYCYHSFEADPDFDDQLNPL